MKNKTKMIVSSVGLLCIFIFLVLYIFINQNTEIEHESTKKTINESKTTQEILLEEWKVKEKLRIEQEEKEAVSKRVEEAVDKTKVKENDKVKNEVKKDSSEEKKSLESEEVEITDQSLENDIISLVNSNLSKTEKSDQAEILAKKYPLENNIDADIAFEKLVKEFNSKAYNIDIQNELRMLSNITLSRSLYRYYEDADDRLKHKVSFNYYQNVKYIYREVEKEDSRAVIINERQITEVLYELGYID